MYGMRKKWKFCLVQNIKDPKLFWIIQYKGLCDYSTGMQTVVVINTPYGASESVSKYSIDFRMDAVDWKYHYYNTMKKLLEENFNNLL